MDKSGISPILEWWWVLYSTLKVDKSYLVSEKKKEKKRKELLSHSIVIPSMNVILVCEQTESYMDNIYCHILLSFFLFFSPMKNKISDPNFSWITIPTMLLFDIVSFHQSYGRCSHFYYKIRQINIYLTIQWQY